MPAAVLRACRGDSKASQEATNTNLDGS